VRSRGFGQSALLLLDAIEVLARERIDYAVIGAMAASIHGVCAQAPTPMSSCF
jgi:hypothetical protein